MDQGVCFKGGTASIEALIASAYTLFLTSGLFNTLPTQTSCQMATFYPRIRKSLSVRLMVSLVQFSSKRQNNKREKKAGFDPIQCQFPQSTCKGL